MKICGSSSKWIHYSESPPNIRRRSHARNSGVRIHGPTLLLQDDQTQPRERSRRTGPTQFPRQSKPNPAEWSRRPRPNIPSIDRTNEANPRSTSRHLLLGFYGDTNHSTLTRTKPILRPGSRRRRVGFRAEQSQSSGRARVAAKRDSAPNKANPRETSRLVESDLLKTGGVRFLVDRSQRRRQSDGAETRNSNAQPASLDWVDARNRLTPRTRETVT
jgi:hypothetical protein